MSAAEIYGVVMLVLMGYGAGVLTTWIVMRHVVNVREEPVGATEQWGEVLESIKPAPANSSEPLTDSGFPAIARNDNGGRFDYLAPITDNVGNFPGATLGTIPMGSPPRGLSSQASQDAKRRAIPRSPSLLAGLRTALAYVGVAILFTFRRYPADPARSISRKPEPIRATAPVPSQVQAQTIIMRLQAERAAAGIDAPMVSHGLDPEPGARLYGRHSAGDETGVGRTQVGSIAQRRPSRAAEQRYAAAAARAVPGEDPRIFETAEIVLPPAWWLDERTGSTT